MALLNQINLMFYSGDTADSFFLMNHPAFLSGKLISIFTACFFSAALPVILFKAGNGLPATYFIGGIFTLFSIFDFILGNYPIWYGMLSVIICVPSAFAGFKYSIKLNQ